MLWICCGLQTAWIVWKVIYQTNATVFFIDWYVQGLRPGIIYHLRFFAGRSLCARNSRNRKLSSVLLKSWQMTVGRSLLMSQRCCRLCLGGWSCLQGKHQRVHSSRERRRTPHFVTLFRCIHQRKLAPWQDNIEHTPGLACLRSRTRIHKCSHDRRADPLAEIVRGAPS